MSVLSDAIKNEIKIVDFAELRGFTITKHGRGYSLKEHDSVHIDTERNIFYRNSANTGGSIIDFAMWIDGVDQETAIKTLRSMLGTNKAYNKASFEPVHTQHTAIPPKGELQLPPRSTENYKRVYGYLLKGRNLSQKVVSNLVHRKMLYEDAVNHNAVWVGYDYDGKAKFACKRITYDKPSKENGFIKGDVTGSQKAVGLFIDNHASSLFLCEAPIDAMSLMTLFDLHKVDFNKYSYLAQGGVAMNALKYHLPHQPGINRIYLCYDNDDAGYIARSNAKELLHELGYKGQVIDKPPHNKDWNEDLKKLSSTFSQSKQNELSLEKSNQTLQIMKR